MKDIARIIIYDVKGMRAVIGAIAGDIIGSAYENDPVKSVDFDLILPCSRYTDDTVLTIAIADSLLSGSSYEDRLRSYAAEYPDAGFSKATLSPAVITNRRQDEQFRQRRCHACQPHRVGLPG